MRPSVDQYFMSMAALVATRSTCVRRQVGCVLIDKYQHVLATGRNGVAKGMAHCNEGHPCPGATARSGENLEGCYAIHAEQNALLQCPDVMQITAAYCTDSPCIHCLRMLLNTGCQTIIYAREYAHSMDLWKAAGRESKHYSIAQSAL